MPSWLFSLSFDQLHPVLVHFPIALLLIAPVFVLLGAFQPSTRGRTLLFSALLLMCLGTIGTFAARLSGEAAARSVSKTAPAHAVLENHEELAETTAIVFAVLTLAFGATLWTIHHLSERHMLQRVLPLVFLLFYGSGIVLLVNTAHLGGQLTHEFGVNVRTQPNSGAVAVAHKTDGDD